MKTKSKSILVIVLFMLLSSCKKDEPYNPLEPVNNLPVKNLAWQQMNGAFGGDIREIVSNPVKGTVYALVNNSGLYKSIDNGKTWEKNYKGNFLNVSMLKNGDIFLLGYSIILYSTDDGENWITIDLSGKIAYSFIVDQKKNIFILEAKYPNFIIHRSSDLGRTWTKITEFTNKEYSFVSGARCFSEGPNGELFLVGGFNVNNSYLNIGINKSIDGGQTWIKTSTLSNNTASHFFVDSNGKIFLATIFGLYYSINGSSWTKTDISTTGIEVIAEKKGFLFAGCSQGVWISNDNGSTWIQSISDFLNPNVKALSVNKDGVIIAGTYGGGIYTSTNNGSNWKFSSTGLISSTVRTLQINSKGDIFAGTGGGGIFRSTDNGLNWESKNEGLTNSYVENLLITKDSYLFAATPSGIFYSSNNADNWSKVENFEKSIKCLGTNSKGTLFAGSWGMYYSTDMGKNWVKNSFPDRWIEDIIINENDYVFAATVFGIYRSTDNGISWNLNNNGIDNAATLSIANNANGNLFAGSSEVYISNDQGLNWSKTALPNLYISIPSIGINHNGYIFVCGNDVFLSTDNGTSWSKTGISATFVYTIAFNSSGNIFIGTENGIYRCSSQY